MYKKKEIILKNDEIDYFNIKEILLRFHIMSEEFNDYDGYEYDDINESIYDDLDKMDRKLEKQLLAEKKERKKEYYVKGADLVAEIRKYQTTKRADAERRGVEYDEGVRRNFRRTWFNDFKNLYSFFNASKILWVFI